MKKLRRPLATVISLSVIGAVFLGATGAVAYSVFGVPPVVTIDAVKFERPLRIPPLAQSTVSAEGERVFALRAQTGATEFVDGVETATSGFSQAYLGPTIVAERGERIAVEIDNALDEPTTVHWHGMHLPAAMDGGPHSMIAAGAQFRAAWRIDQPAATLWYHPHPHGATERQVRDGMAGIVLLRDEVEAALPLPRDYGVDDIPVVVTDVAFDAAGAFRHDETSFVGKLGDQLLVNGTIGPYLEVTTDLVRLRLVNASSARVYQFAFEDERPFSFIASDGGLLTAPVELTTVRLSPGERAEILVSLTPGETVRLQSLQPDLGEVGLSFGSIGARDSFDVLQLRAAPTLDSRGTVPSTLVDVPAPNESGVAAERNFVLDNTEINGLAMDMDRIDVVAELGTSEIWTVRNAMTLPHNFHIHGPQFRILSIDGAAPPAALAGFKDTVYLEPNVAYRLLVSFDDFADPTTPFMFHCHLLQHEDEGMMGQFVVVEPGQSAEVPTASTTGAPAPATGAPASNQENTHHDH